MDIQGLSKRLTFLKLPVLVIESTKGDQICGKISINGKIFRLALKKNQQELEKN